MDNKINKDCIIHKKICDLFCTYSKCVNKILCQKCIQDHLQVHPRQFIYSVQNLCEIHSFDKVTKMKQVLGKYKVMNEQRIIKMYNPFQVILNPLIQRLKVFEKQSKDMIVKKLLGYLLNNKNIIQGTKINKSDTNAIKTKPQLMVQQTIAQVQLINQRQALLKQNTENYTWYANATEQLCTQAITQITKMVNVAIKLLDNYTIIQQHQYADAPVGMDDHHEQSFYKRYINSHQVALKGDRNNMEMTLIQSKKQMQRKDQEIKRVRNQIKQKVTKIEELNLKIEGLKEELLAWEQKLEREERQRKQAAGRQKKKLQEYLIKSDVISDGGHSINLQKKTLQQKYLSLILQLVPNPIQLQLSQHCLTKEQLKLFHKCSSLQVLRMSFMHFDKQFLAQSLNYYQNIHTLELNSASIDDDALMEISMYFPPKLKHLHLIDNKIGDDGLDYMFKNMKATLESLFVSYNNLTPRAIQIINRFCFEIKTLHISKNDIKNKGANAIGKYLKNIQQLFVGGTGIQKDGFLSICRNCFKLKRLSLVATEVNREIVYQILSTLPKLQWLDISYSGINQADLEKVQKLKMFNQNNVQIICLM